MSTTVDIVYPTRASDLYQRFPGQHEAQPVYVSLDCRTGKLTAAWSGTVGGGVPADVWHHLTLRWKIPALTVDAAETLLDQLEPLAQRVLDGFEARFDGHNLVGTLSDDAAEAREAISDLCYPRRFDECDTQQRWEAGDWYAATPRRQLLADSGLTASTTDEQLADIVRHEESSVNEPYLVDGIEAFWSDLRDELRADAADAEVA